MITATRSALLVHQTPELPLPLTRLSRWLDRHTDPIESLIAEFEAQPWRRIVQVPVVPLAGFVFHVIELSDHVVLAAL